MMVNLNLHERVWHYGLVGSRLIEAASVVRRTPMRIWPKQFGTAWPRFEAMTAAELFAFKRELQEAGQLEAWEREQNRQRIPPSGIEIELCEEALGWMPRYFKHEPDDVAQSVGFWAAKTYSIDEAEIPQWVLYGLKIISRGLRRDRVRVRG
ncbi:hypothetical protein HAP48_0043050 [Bradyrhizobium septentrionale]|uniref:Uncharacterized protein n=1 Tax=Bradyrhizobium septentrionale TaxID=1404411 RepID=A0A973W2Y5_9BRAD|nr:hypothetical protein [Bradyrhizobium septentrionale]UGY15237.1 hypothetical protein HAP48_0043050 [Bradyrhizobium septentrionale]UGY23820.1 hypothetical protein HU675_0038715 [Bradyrhizobium septentrionale]